MAIAGLGMALRHLSDLFNTGTVTGLGDGQLLARYSASKDTVAFEALVARHGPMVLATCRAVLKNEHDVEDAFQTTFLVLAKKAHSIRAGDTLGGWLHRVAYRAAVEASVAAKKRRRKEAEASAMAPLNASRRGFEADHDLRSILHDAIDRLPESQRLPVVLCDLEGLSYEQAAEQLRWTVPTLRCRLAKARQRLKRRLTRHGFANPDSAIVLVAKGGMAAVPPALMRATILAATGGPASVGAALLTKAILKGMMMTKIKFAATAAMAAAALASAGVIAVGGARPEDPEPAMKPKAAVAAVHREKPTAQKPIETVEVKGRVVAPDGRPVGGAEVTALYLDTEALNVDTPAVPWPRTTSGPDGRFSIRLPKPKLSPSIEGYLAMEPWLVGSAPGFGLGWCERGLGADRPAEPVVTLVEEGPPIEGQIVDIEGQPVVGASVRASRIWYDEKGNLAGRIAKARNGAAGNLWQGLGQLLIDAPGPKPGRDPRERLVSIATTTAADGRFKLTGIGRDRIADLIVSCPGIATTQAHVFSLLEPEIRTADTGRRRIEQFIVHAPKFQLAMAPTRRVQGTIRDKDSGRPIAGLEIQAAVFEEQSDIPAPGVEATTDADGRYRLDGLPKAAAYQLFIKAAKGLPYAKATIKVPVQSSGLEPFTFDVAMRRAVLIRGRVVDKVTGLGIRGSANYYAFADNLYVPRYPGFSESGEQLAPLDQDGRFEVVALPGRGIVAIRDAMDQYRPASGYQNIAGYDAKNHIFKTVPHLLTPGSDAIIAEVVVDPKAESVSLDLQADPGKSVAIKVVGPDGAPIGDTKVKGQRELYQSAPLRELSSTFEVHALDPSSPRLVVVTHEGRKLIGSVLLKGDESGPVTGKLQPWGSVAGRIVDDEARPRRAVCIWNIHSTGNKRYEIHPMLSFSEPVSGIRSGDDGRFLVEGLIPGLKYSAWTYTGFAAFGWLFVDVTVASGVTKDLGDLKVRPLEE